MAKQPAKKKLVAKFKKAASTNSNRVHVVPSKDGWSVKKEGAKRSIKVTPTKQAAVKAANTLKKVDRIIVHKRDGTIQKSKKSSK